MKILSDLEALSVTLSKMEESWKQYLAEKMAMSAMKRRAHRDDPLRGCIPSSTATTTSRINPWRSRKSCPLALLSSPLRNMLLTSTLGAVLAGPDRLLSRRPEHREATQRDHLRDESRRGGDRERRIDWDRDDEFGQVAAATNQMLDFGGGGPAEGGARGEGRRACPRTRSLFQPLGGHDEHLRFFRPIPAGEQRVRALLGYSQSEILERSLFDFLHPDDFEVTATELEKYQKTGGASVSFENRLRYKDGSWRYVSWNAVPVRESELIYGVARDITEKRLALEAEQRRTEKMLQFQRALLQLRDSDHGDLDTFFRSATEECAKSLEVERVSIWNFNDATSEIVCMDQFTLSQQQHSSGSRLSREELPSYFSVIEKLEPVVADDALAHPATAELRDGYLVPQGIGSMLDVPMKAAGRLVGVICCEHVGAAKKWSDEEVKFVSGISGSIMIAIERQERMAAEEKLRVSEEYNRGIVQSTQDCVKIPLAGGPPLSTWRSRDERRWVSGTSSLIAG